MSASTIYDFETIIPAAIKAAFVAQSIVAYTEADDPEFQREIPRTEIYFVPGAGKGHWGPVADELRETAWDGNVQIHVLTAAVPATHAEYLATVRNIMHSLAARVNGTQLTNHAIAKQVFDTGSSGRQMASDQSAFRTVLSFKINFSVQANAWALL